MNREFVPSTFRWTLALSALLGLSIVVSARGQDDAAAALVAGAGRYVEEYERQFPAVVGEVHEQQRIVKADGAVKRRRELVADVLIIKVGADTSSFRDVISVDGKPVRNRDERLRKLFLGESRSLDKQARAISAESSRYDIGVERNMDTLMLPLAILHADRASGFRFVRTPDGLAFTEFRSPAMVRSRSRGAIKDMFLRGSFTIDTVGSRVRSATLTAANDVFELTEDIVYVEDRATQLLVPLRSTETYRPTGNPKGDRTVVMSTFANFRKFKVIVDEQLALPTP